MITIDSNTTKALLFDLDGTLILSEEIHYKNFKEVLDSVGIELMSFDEFIQNYSGKGGQFILKMELEKFNSDADLQSLISKKQELFRKHILEHGVEMTKGTQDILIKAKDLGFKLGLVTGSFYSNFEAITSKIQLPDLFDIIITNEDIKEPKPSPFAYNLAAERLEVKNTECVVFEDAANGIESARNAFMRPVAITTYTSAEKFKELFGTIETIKDFTEVTMI